MPVFKIEGTDFYVDVRCNEFREVDRPSNCISFDEIVDILEEGVTGFVYDKETKNLYAGIIDPDNIPDNVTFIVIPQIVELDPVGIARKNGLHDNAYTWLTEKQNQTELQRATLKHKRGHRL